VRRVVFVAAAVCALAATPLATAGLDRPPAPAQRALTVEPRGSYVPGEVIVQFRAKASRAARGHALARVPARVAERLADVRANLMKLSRGTSVQAAVRAYNADPAVAFAEPNYLRHVDGTTLDTTNLWGLNNTAQVHSLANTASTRAGVLDADIDAPEAWAAVAPNNNPIIAVIDTGVDVAHADLDGRLWVNTAELVGDPGVDDDGNGYQDDVNGYDFAHNDGSTLVDATLPHFVGWDHGTHVAGTIAAEHNGSGVMGVCDDCRIMVLKIADDSTGAMDIRDEAEALDYAKANGARVVNLSLGGPDFSNMERNAISRFGRLAAVAAGNEALDNDMFLNADADGDTQFDTFSPSYPASFTLGNILTVGASNDMDENAYSTACFNSIASKPECAFTNWGHDSVDVSAPGADIMSTVPGNAYETWDGTSMATPHVAGIAGLLLASNPALTTAQLKNKIMRGVDKPDSLDTVHMPSYVTGTARSRNGSFSRTTGRANASGALAAGTSSATPSSDGNINGAKGMSTATVSGQISWPADINDVRKKKLVRGGVYRITLTVPSGRDYDLYVWEPGSKEIWQPNMNRAASLSTIQGRDELVQFVAAKTGVHYIQVSAWLLESGGYKLTVKRVA
jgi:subtilisin family serine protease